MNLHNEIMNIPVPNGFDYSELHSMVTAYKTGHRDARHSAAELANKYDTMIEELLDALEARNADDYVDAFKAKNGLHD